MKASDIQKQVGWNCVRLRRDYAGNILRLSLSMTSSPAVLIECDRCNRTALYLDVSGNTVLGYCLTCALTLGLEIDDNRIFGA
jgi:hypothetical protein